MNEFVELKGYVTGKIEYACGKIETIEFPNAILNTGRQAVAASLGRKIGDAFNFYINRMEFGDGGTTDGTTTKYVSAERNGFFGTTRASMPVIATIDQSVPSQVIFTSVLPFISDANGYSLNEMSLKMATGNLYSMVTFPDLTKTQQMQITWSWRLSFI